MLAKLAAAVLLSPCLTYAAFAQDKSGPTNQKTNQTVSTSAPRGNQTAPAPEIKPANAAAAAKPKAAPAKAAPAVEVKQSEPEESDTGMVTRMLPFQENWEEATPDEKALFLGIYAESQNFLQEQWDKATPEERQDFLKNYPLLSARSLKHRWSSATPEERTAFLEAHPRTNEKIKEGWDDETPEQRKILAKEHSYMARRALYHGWSYATPQEKMAFLDAHPKLRAQLKSKWTGATAEQKAWYEQNYAGLMDPLAHNKLWTQTSFLERVTFLEATPAISEKLRDEWQKNSPEERAQLVRKWAGWPIKELTTKAEKTASATVSPGKKHHGKKSKHGATSELMSPGLR